MDKYPKRKKRKDNPYKLYINNSEYIIEFNDKDNQVQKVIVSKEIYDTFNDFELHDKKLMNEEERHFEQFDLSEQMLYKRAQNSVRLLEDEVIMKLTFEELRNAINTLPEIQKRRIKMYYYEELTFEAIAKIEGCTKRAVKFSVDVGLEKIKQIIKK